MRSTALSGTGTAFVVPDTGVLIEVFRHVEAADEIERRRWRFRVSAVVISELARGVRSLAERRYVAAVARNFSCFAPTPAQWHSCGDLLATLCRQHHFDATGLRAIQNDVLIARTARDLGWPVVTTNVSDFRLIASHLRGLSVIDFPTHGTTR